MAAVETPYEELRRRKLEENKKKMEELKLSHLCSTLRSVTTPKPSPTKQVKRKATMLEGVSFPVRRSSRVAQLPSANYKEASYDDDRVRVVGPRRYYQYQRRDLSNRVYASDEARLYATERAEEVQSKLEHEFPSFVKPMLQSHVTGGFWLGLPVQFCKRHLPHRNTPITLEDENGEESNTLFLSQKSGLSAGWRGFSINHELVDGDALVFQLVNATTFKVYIIRASGFE